MAILGDLLVQGRSRFLQQIYAPGISIDGDTTVTGTLTLSKIQDAAGTANNNPALIVGGPVTGSHLEFDSNEIMAKATGTTTADLYINTDGGIIFLGKSGVKTQVQGNLQVQGTSTFTGAGTYSGNLTVNGTTSLKGTGITGDLTVSNNAKINGSLIVEDEIRTPKWIVDNIANLGGEFIIAPTIIGGDNVSVNVSAVSNGKYTITVTDSSITSSSFGGIAWSNSSIVKVSGTINDVVLVSVNGTMTQALNTTTNTIQFTVNSSDVTLTAGTYTGNKVKNLHIMMYKNAGIVPVGIFMTSYGESKYPYIDIYSGSSSGSSYSPTTRLGYLTGIKDENGNALTVNGVSPTGWGLYTNNGYFSGTIVSTSGKIGGFTIGTTDIHNGKTSRTETTNNGVWVGTDGIGFGKGITYFSTDGTGKIGPWTLSTTYIRNGSITGATNTSVAGVYLGTDGLNISNGTAATTTYITKTAVNVGNKLTWNGTTLTVTGTVNATAGYFGSSSSNGWQIDSNAIKHGTLGSSGGYILNASGNSTATINGASRSNLALAIGSKFGVGNDGTLYANGANITNINASNINAGTLNISYLPESVKNENIEIGGRNLLSKSQINPSNWVHTIANTTTYTGDGYENIWTMVKTSAWEQCYLPVTVSQDTEYTFSLEYIVGKAYNRWNASTPLRFQILPDVPPNADNRSQEIAAIEVPSVVTSATRDSVTFTTSSDMIYLNIAGGYVADGTTDLPIEFNYLKLEKGNKATDWTPAPEDVDTNITNAAKTAANYIYADSNGIKIASANPSTQNQRLELTNSTLKMYSSDNIQRIKLDSSSGVIIGKETQGHIQITDAGLYVFDTNNKKRTTIDANGLTVYNASQTDVANFGTTARIGVSNSSRFLMNADSLQAYNSSNVKYFEVSASGMSFGSNTVASTTYVDTKKTEAIAAGYANYGYKYTKDIIIYGESNKYYPVYFDNNQTDYDQNIPHNILIKRGYSEQAPSDWNTATHKGGLTLRIRWNYGGWGGATYVAQIYEWSESYSTIVGDVLVGNKSGMNSTIYLRGGGTTGAIYHIYCDVSLNSTRYGASFPYIGTDTPGTVYMRNSDTYYWTVDSPLITPNKDHILSLATITDEQYIYKTTVSGTTGVSAATTWITTSAYTANTWVNKRPAYDSNYPVLFIARQRKLATSHVTCTTPVIDDTLTIIDGGHITTGTIDTNRLNANTIKSNIVQTTELNADKITSGTIAAARIAAGSITADKIDATNLHVSAANIDGSLTIGNIDGLQTALNGKQPTGSYATTTQLATKSDKTLPDTRNDNQPPSWYISTYPRQSITEFKFANKIGFTSAASNIYCTLTTIVPWNDASGGYPTQSTIVSGVKYYRVGTGASTWSDWSAEETAAGAQAKADAKDDAIAAAAKRTNVAVAVTAIDYDLGTATLQATLYVDGTATTSNVTYKWLKDGSIISGQTARTLSVTAAMGLSHVYSCTVTYS